MLTWRIRRITQRREEGDAVRDAIRADLYFLFQASHRQMMSSVLLLLLFHLVKLTDSIAVDCDRFPALPLAANATDSRYGGASSVIRRHVCQPGFHLYGPESGERAASDCVGDSELEVPSACALDATRHEAVDVSMSSGNFPWKAVDSDNSGIHRGGYGERARQSILLALIFTLQEIAGEN